ncbi:NAD-dependent epimerase/dehydratase family protein [Pseudomonas typographi]|uniref:NAD-dependent epimerase/dehydratase family protein n=1 Tax=Pseudomonas typographi TaxID=2715964 RepID=UPI0016831344|nr:NAD-dependent epimerase/dehydratase family protein [Pseudomonas typographi]MBD1552064.1 NAD-dependent epimerase/dehydratase family protein [Pseudomonas typographi]MBD1586628.1 NAD-dependent epimerase/dehydratase family protein [Pseudomonas typographi]
MSLVVALTGGSGFIGGQIARMLVAQGFNVRALSRTQSGLKKGVFWVRGSLEDTRSLAELVAGAGVVIHCAGAVRGRDAHSFRAVNVDGSRRVMEAARQSGTCERFLHMSSLAARYPELSWYSRSKFDAEQEVLRAAGTVSVAIFRPTAVYGPGDRELQPLFSWLLRGLLLRLGAGEAHLSFVHVFDLTAAVVQWVSSPEARPGTYELGDGTLGGYSWKGLASIAADIRQARVREIPVSLTLLKCIARANLALSYLLPRAPMLTTSKVNELTHHDWTCSNTAITAALGWVPQIKLRRALQDGLF